MRYDPLILDVDGTLTDGRLYLGEQGEPARAFHTQDGLAIRWFQRLGGTVIILTGKSSHGVARRAAELEIAHVVQGSNDKLADARRLFASLGRELGGAAVVGDDLPDLPLFHACGFSIAPANAVPEVCAAAKFVTKRPGGAGAVREAIEHLLRRDGRWAEVLQHYSSPREAEAVGRGGP